MNPWVLIILKVLAAIGLMLANGVVLIYMLRKVLGHLHVRIGPNRVGPLGLVQTTADVLKLLTKEDFNPTATDKWLFRLAPMVVFVPSLMAYAALSFGPGLLITDLDTGLLYTMAALSIVPLGVLMAGWASSNKWSLLGGMRAAAMQIAYEVPLLLSVLGVAMMAGTLNLGQIVAAQSGSWTFWPGGPGLLPRWFLFPQLPGFVIFLVAALAELNQTPFDLSEAESELIAGFANEYSSMKFGFLFLAEFSNSFVMSAVAVTLFFGGWTGGFGVIPPVVVFMLKTYAGIFVLMWVRGTMPRMRIDHVLEMGWKGLIPLSLAWIVATGLMIKVLG